MRSFPVNLTFKVQTILNSIEDIIFAIETVLPQK